MYPPGLQTLPQINNPQDRTPHLGPAPRPSPSLNGMPPQPPQLGPSGPPGPSGPTGPPQSGLPPYGRAYSPPQDLRPMRDERPPSSNSNYHHPPPLPPAPSFQNVNNGPHPTSQPNSAVEAMRIDREERPPSALKRQREWEQETPIKKPANEETRARLDEHPSRRYSPPGRIETPRDRYRRSSSEIRRENDQRRANENYHPSEAAHHPYSLQPQPVHPTQQPPQPQQTPQPQQQQQQQIPSLHTIMDAPKEEARKEIDEPAARKVNVDEDYDNNSEDDKRRASPNGSITTKQEPQSAQ